MHLLPLIRSLFSNFSSIFDSFSFIRIKRIHMYIKACFLVTALNSNLMIMVGWRVWFSLSLQLITRVDTKTLHNTNMFKSLQDLRHLWVQAYKDKARRWIIVDHHRLLHEIIFGNGYNKGSVHSWYNPVWNLLAI